MRKPVPPILEYDDLLLLYQETVPGNAERGLVPFHHFHIFHADTYVGHINFRVGNTEHVLRSAGHIGYEIHEQFRGRGFAYKACQALAPFVRKIYESVVITVDPANVPSIKVVESLGAVFLDVVEVPEQDPAFASGARRKLRYEWVP